MPWATGLGVSNLGCRDSLTCHKQARDMVGFVI